MKFAFLLVMALFLSSCVRTVQALLVNPTTGETAQCEGSGAGPAPVRAALATSHLNECIEKYQKMGYVKSDDLTPEQKAKFNIP